jgi:hypothetical protein
MVLTPKFCFVHPQRGAFALCMKCRRNICQECATQWDGIYHCAQCLAAQRSASRSRSRVTGWIALGGGALILLYIGAHAMVWAGALIAGLF